MPLHSWLAPADTKGTRKVNVSFPVPPPEKGDVATVPKEALYPTAIVIPFAVIIILLTAKWWLALILLAVFAGLGYGFYKYVGNHFEENHSAIQNTFLIPIQNGFKREGVELSAHQIAYLWNYGSVRVSRSQVVSLENDWAEGAVFVIETP